MRQKIKQNDDQKLEAWGIVLGASRFLCFKNSSIKGLFLFTSAYVIVFFNSSSIPSCTVATRHYVPLLE